MTRLGAALRIEPHLSRHRNAQRALQAGQLTGSINAAEDDPLLRTDPDA